MQEAAQLRTGDFAGAQDSRRRAEPLLGRLAGQAGAADESVRARVEAVLAFRQRTHEWLAAELAVTRKALDRIGSVQQRLDRIAPAYRGTGANVAPHFCAQG